MLNQADQARARRYAERIRSGRAKRGPYSIYGRIRAAHIDGAGEMFARAYCTQDISEAELERALLRHESSQPQCFVTKPEIDASLRVARATEYSQKTVIRDVNRTILSKLSPDEKLTWANDGSLPRRFVLKDPDDE